MKHLTRQRFKPRLEALENRWCPSASTLSIQDFLAAQGTTSFFNYGVPNLPDEVGWGSSTSVFNSGNGIFARVDYTGQDAAFLGLNLGTTTSGTVSARPLSGGGQQVTVNLHTHNAFAWAQKFTTTFDPTIPPPPGDLLFGNPPSQLAVNAPAALADSNLQVVYTVAPGAPVFWNLVDFNLPAGLPSGDALVSESFHATATGTTPMGQEATLVVSQTGVLNRTPTLIRDFGFTAEVVDVQVHGNASDVAVPTANPAASGAAAVLSAPAKHSTNSLDAAFAASLDDPLGLNNS